ncbi:carboxymuconolactone decarboxylase family protein [Pelomonas aquatica]|jgi:AhpD family alkylhydroperoxidase|uniref:Carboxymuconolactone decarboxylase family protein n=1 Tax=Pelomonas aquatica TaxID=431058 RepID=A0A9X4LL88_9BURK|nr:carboxymuconolactone decarboxylase family protein [Pelomonas aquatica]MCY4753658.1 carboxymuconolactone decarboxylase family protein [Pelomonas aquatica]MDG0864996.1 carboxymuconolactone decarboxylase family protein [Pelomonas aquatica]
MSTPRIDYHAASPAAMKAMLSMSAAVNNLGLEHSLLELVKMRASQINGCAFCLDMHARDARKAGESERRLHVLPAWRETGLFSRREQAALAWTEALTLVTQGHAPDADYDLARSEFSDAELVNLTLAITTINAWNRFAIGFRKALPVEQ